MPETPEQYRENLRGARALNSDCTSARGRRARRLPVRGLFLTVTSLLPIAAVLAPVVGMLLAVAVGK